MPKRTIPQKYPRIEDDKSKFYGYLDDSKLVQHQYKIPIDKLREFILSSISNANIKSSRLILNIPVEASNDELEKIYKKVGKGLFQYFKKYCGDPATTAYEIINKHYSEVCEQQFLNRAQQKERMNSGWRYQFLAKDCAIESKRFRSMSDIGAEEADFNALIDFIKENLEPLSLYVSIKNRSNTMGGQDWPKAIYALEEIAKSDKNRTGPYCCVFGIVMERGLRNIKTQRKTKRTYSDNTEVWKSDFFWPFFANFEYDEIINHVVDMLVEIKDPQNPKHNLTEVIPEGVKKTFGELCSKHELINAEGYFNDSHKLVKFFCRK